MEFSDVEQKMLQEIDEIKQPSKSSRLNPTRKMEIMVYDDDTITIRMSRKQEFVRILSVMRTASTEYSSLDEELLGFSEDQIEEVTKSLFSLVEPLKSTP